MDHTKTISINFINAGSSFSAVGTDAKLPIYNGKRTMNLGRVDERTILHETGHALSLVHEHQHPEGKIQWDTDKVLLVLLHIRINNNTIQSMSYVPCTVHTHL